jgi:hypothetical protein
MATYLLIESRDPFEAETATREYTELARELRAAGASVTLFLVQNGVLPARPGKRSAHLAELADAGVRILADDFSLRERGITKLVAGVTASPIDVVIERMAAGDKVVFH